MEHQDEERRGTTPEASSRGPAGLVLIPALLLQHVWSMSLHTWEAPRVRIARRRVSSWRAQPYSGSVALLVGTAFITLLVVGINRVVVPLPNPGVVYLPLVAMLAYHWSSIIPATSRTETVS
ncbi:MAG TPA: hypothetical protein VKT52_09905 [Ktedonobacterales bacterium]|nr:hypothetical protein [Ktedonobacterales bacterium]